MVADNSEKSTKSVANGSLISTVSSKDDLPNAIIVTQVPEDVSFWFQIGSTFNFYL